MLFHFTAAVSGRSGLHVGFDLNLRSRDSTVFEFARGLLRRRIVIKNANYRLLFLFHPVLHWFRSIRVKTLLECCTRRATVRLACNQCEACYP
jgi:hypothetical protein